MLVLLSFCLDVGSSLYHEVRSQSSGMQDRPILLPVKRSTSSFYRSQWRLESSSESSHHFWSIIPLCISTFLPKVPKTWPRSRDFPIRPLKRPRRFQNIYIYIFFHQVSGQLDLSDIQTFASMASRMWRKTTGLTGLLFSPWNGCASYGMILFRLSLFRSTINFGTFMHSRFNLFSK